MNTDQYINKQILVGLTYVDGNGQVTKQVQMHGTITCITDEGIFFERSGGGEFSLPADLESLKPADPGEYTIRSTGEVIINPDYLSLWTVNSPPAEEE